VHIDKGMEDGQRITFAGEGDMEPGLDEPGDIIVVLDEKPHETFKRLRSEHLVTNMNLTLTEALCGFQKTITTLDNRTLVVTAIPGEVIKHGCVKCILGEGMPRHRNPFEKGKLIIQFAVDFPERIDPHVALKLESILPPRPQVDIPIGDEVEEVNLVEVDMEREHANSRGRGHSQDAHMSDDEEGGHGPHMQCATH